MNNKENQDGFVAVLLSIKLGDVFRLWCMLRGGFLMGMDGFFFPAGQHV